MQGRNKSSTQIGDRDFIDFIYVAAKTNKNNMTVVMRALRITATYLNDYQLAKGPLSHSFLTNRQRMAFNTARIITPTSAKIARYILAMPTAPKIRQAALTPKAMVMF